MGKLLQLRTDFRWKGCHNFLYEDGGVPPKILHLGDFGKFSVSSGDPPHTHTQTTTTTTTTRENPVRTMFLDIASKSFQSRGLLYFRVSVSDIW